METAAAVEINKGSLRRYFLYRFPPLLEKVFARNAPTFSQLHTGPTAVNLDSLSMAAFHLRNADFLSEGWGVPQWK